MSARSRRSMSIAGRLTRTFGAIAAITLTVVAVVEFRLSRAMLENELVDHHRM
jgi:hypothetical protein